MKVGLFSASCTTPEANQLLDFTKTFPSETRGSPGSQNSKWPLTFADFNNDDKPLTGRGDGEEDDYKEIAVILGRPSPFLMQEEIFCCYHAINSILWSFTPWWNKET